MTLLLLGLALGFLLGVLATAYLCMVAEFGRRDGMPFPDDVIDLTGMRPK